MSASRGQLITLEGGEGAGKSTVLAALETFLHEQGVDILRTREPGGTPAGEAIRAVLLDRALLHQRIAERFVAMLDTGLEAEVTMLRQRYRLHAALPSMRCVGYRQVWEVQEGLAPRSELRDRGIYATRQLAKRQITWIGNSLRPEIVDCLAANVDALVIRKVAHIFAC